MVKTVVQTRSNFFTRGSCNDARKKRISLCYITSPRGPNLFPDIFWHLPRSLEIGFHPFIRSLTVSAPRIWYASLFAKPRCRYQPSRANAKISYKVRNWHASPPPPLRRETAATTSGWPHYRLQDIQGHFGYWPELVFPSSRSTQPKGAPLQSTLRCQCLQEKVGERLDRSLSPLTEHSPPPLSPTHLHTTH